MTRSEVDKLFAQKREISEILLPQIGEKLPIPLYLCSVEAGFPSPADDYMEGRLDLNSHLIQNPTATFFVRVSGDSMINAGIYPDDLLIVDRSLTPKDNSIVIAVLDGDLTVKRLLHEKGGLFLKPENCNYPLIKIGKETHFEIWGVVTNVIHSVL